MPKVDTWVAARVAGVERATIRQWVRRGHLCRYEDGVDLAELMIWIDTIRDTDKARGAVLATESRVATRRDEADVA